MYKDKEVKKNVKDMCDVKILLGTGISKEMVG
jgi:hypothetical protein